MSDDQNKINLSPLAQSLKHFSRLFSSALVESMKYIDTPISLPIASRSPSTLYTFIKKLPHNLSLYMLKLPTQSLLDITYSIASII